MTDTHFESTVGTDGNTFDVALSRSTLTFQEARRLRDELTAALIAWKLHDYRRRKHIRVRETVADEEAMSILHNAAALLKQEAGVK